MDTLDDISKQAQAFEDELRGIAEQSQQTQPFPNTQPEADAVEATQQDEKSVANAVDAVLNTALKPNVQRVFDKKDGEWISAEVATENPKGSTGIPPKKRGRPKKAPDDSTLPDPILSEKKLLKLRDSVRRTGRVTKAKKRVRIAPSDIVRFIPQVRSKRMRQLFEIILENPTIEMEDAMKIVGYSKHHPPGQVANSKGWQYLIKHYFKDDQLAEREKMLLYNDDPRYVNASLDRIHKIRGSFIHVQQHELGPAGAFGAKTDKELLEMIEEENLEKGIQEDNQTIEGEEIIDQGPDASTD